MAELLTREAVQADIDSLPRNYKTADVDRLIKRYVKEGRDLSALRDYVLSQQQFHRIYFHTSLKQISDPAERLAWIDKNLLFSDWWHTDECIDFVKDVDVDTALSYAKRYVRAEDTFIRRWGYVMFISRLCRKGEYLNSILSLMHNDDEYYVQMAEAWLIAELAVFFPLEVYKWICACNLKYNITGKAIQKICDSYRIDEDTKERFKAIRAERRLLK